MKTYGALHPTDLIPQPPDTVLTMLVEGSSGQAMDWGSTLAQMVRLTGVTTTGGGLNFFASLNSTGAAAPSSGTSTGTTAGGLPSLSVIGQGTFQIPGGSTGFSVAALSSGYIRAELWKQ
jgi:hypothetical protein